MVYVVQIWRVDNSLSLGPICFLDVDLGLVLGGVVDLGLCGLMPFVTRVFMGVLVDQDFL